MALGMHGVQYEKVNEHVGSVAREGKRNERNGHSRGDLGGLGNRLRQNHRVKRRRVMIHRKIASQRSQSRMQFDTIARRRPKKPIRNKSTARRFGRRAGKV